MRRILELSRKNSEPREEGLCQGQSAQSGVQSHEKIRKEREKTSQGVARRGEVPASLKEHERRMVGMPAREAPFKKALRGRFEYLCTWPRNLGGGLSCGTGAREQVQA